MIFTITLNPALDKTVIIPDFKLGEVNRIQSSRCDAGGKGLNVSSCICSLGGISTAATLLGGSTGTFIRNYIERQSGIIPEIVDLEADTRTNLKIIDPVSHTNTDINDSGPEVNDNDFNLLSDRLFSSIRENDIIVLSGSIPTGLNNDSYARLIEKAHQCNALTFLDASGEALSLGIKAVPYLIKPNISELSQFAGRTLSDEKDILDECKKLLDKGISRIIVSMGSDGAYYISKEICMHGLAPRVCVKSTVGAGDAMVAALAFCKSELFSARQAFTLALAFGSASVTSAGTQAPSKDLVDSLYSQVEIIDITL